MPSTKPKFSPTAEQAAVVAAIASPKGSIMIEAGAGCAKSSTLELAAPGVKVPALALAFNKSTAAELAKRLPSNFTPKTMHGLGFGAWGRACGSTKLTLDKTKAGRLISQAGKDFGIALDSDLWSGCRDMLARAMQLGLLPEAEGPGLVPDDPSTWDDIADDCGAFGDDKANAIDIAKLALTRSIAEGRQGTLSFDEMIYLPTMLGGQFPQFPVVFVDEDQDLSPMDHRILGLASRANGRTVAVGDRHQSIYAFRGAHGESAEQIRSLRPAGEWTDLPLLTTFRCPEVVVERQQNHIPGFRCAPGAAKGQIINWAKQGFEFLEPLSWSWEKLAGCAGQLPEPDPQLAILCRNNGPLMAMAFRLIRARVGVKMLGRDLGKGLIALSSKICKEDSLPADACRGRINEWRVHESSLALANSKPERVAGIVDRAECLFAVLDSGARDAGELRARINGLFARETGLVTLGSIHKAKGLEWDLVVHLDPWRIPSRQARRMAAEGSHGALVQEMNLRYVAETRTKHTLVLANLDDFGE